MDYYQNAQFNYQDYAGRAKVLDVAKTYTFDGEHFDVRILPGITSISEQSCYRGSGMELEIKGTSFMPGYTRFFIAGIECEITEEPWFCPKHKVYTAKCAVPEVPEVFEQNFYIGGHGWE